MARYATTDMGFPRFRGAVRDIIIASTAIYVFLLLFGVFGPRGWASQIVEWSVLTPEGIRQGHVWQFLTYAFIQGSPLNFLFSMLGIYFIGTAVEERIGYSRFLEMFFTAIVGAGLLGFLLSFTKVMGQGPAIGSGPAANAILIVFYLLYREARVMPMFIPIPIPVKYIVIFAAAVQGAYLLLTHFSLFFCTQLLGMVVGYAWYRVALRRRNYAAVFENKVLSLRNSYYRWKRRRAGKKFQVYMRKHQHDPKQYFDEYGNFRPPDDDDKKDRGPGGWVN